MKRGLILFLTLMMALNSGLALSQSVHKEQSEALQDVGPNDDALEAQAAEKSAGKPTPLQKATSPRIGDDFIVLGYSQIDYDYIYHVRWEAMTHITSLFVSFDTNGNLSPAGITSALTNRPNDLKAGGAADAAGVKFLLTVNSFDDGGGGAIEQVMTNATKRSQLVDDIVATVTGDGYCHGVTVDVEFSWSTAVRDGLTLFFQELRTDLASQYEVSVYTHPTFNSNLWDFDATTGITPHIDYMIYSSYTYAGSSTVNAVADFSAFRTQMRNYMNDGLPPEKLVVALPAYGRYYDGATGYEVSGTRDGAIGYFTGIYETTLEPDNSGPYTRNYDQDDAANWYTFNDGTNHVAVYDDEEAYNVKIRLPLSMNDPNGDWNGRRLRGVAYWSLYWMSNSSASASWDPISGSLVGRTRTYSHIFQMNQEFLAAPGDEVFHVTGFEGLDYRWRDPNESPDTTGDSDGDSARAIQPSPAGGGAPADTTNAMRVIFDFEGATGNKAFFRHEVLAHPSDTTVIDTNAVAALFDSTTLLSAYVNTAAAYAGYTVRMAVMDANGDLEVSDTFSLGSSGWQELTWDLTDASGINAYTTSEPAFSNGDGTLDTAGSGARDIAFIGFIVEGDGAQQLTLYFDELTYTHINAGGLDYKINEFRYDAVDGEFVEIYGPAGSLPAGMQLRVYDSSDGSLLDSYNLSGSIPNDTGTGFGFFVVGDPGVSNVDFSTGFSGAADDIANTDPSGIQLYNTSNGGVYDSVVYQAWGGLDRLVELNAHGVADEGYPWMGRTAGGDGPEGDYTKGRYPDGADTSINYNDFSAMAATPGAANGDFITTDVTFDFNSVPSGAFQTFDSFSSVSSGVGSSPSGGNVYRCIDPSGGGVIGFIGDKSMGSDGNGYTVTGEIYIPSGSDPDQAIAIGICGSHGSAFFTSNNDAYGYEDGYWLIYENAAGIGLNDGQPDHAGSFDFVHASNDNQDGAITTYLGGDTLASTSAAAGAWTTFELVVDPGASPSNQLIARINGSTLYSGSIPAGGPIQGAFQVGFRENHVGAPASNEGTWIDNLSIDLHGVTGVDEWNILSD